MEKPEQQIGTEGIIKEIKMVDSRTGEVTFHQDEPFNNLITDVGLELLHRNVTEWFVDITGLYKQLSVGSGDTAPQVTDTSLENSLGTSDAIESTTKTNFLDNSPYYFEVESEWRFDAGTATGTIRELGLRSGQATPNNNDLFARALIKDNQGFPFEIVKEDFNILFVTYAVRFYVDPVPDYTTTIAETNAGTSYTGTLSAAGVAAQDSSDNLQASFWNQSSTTANIGPWWYVVNTDQITPPSPGTQEWTDVKFGTTDISNSNVGDVDSQSGYIVYGSDGEGMYAKFTNTVDIADLNYNNGIETVLIGGTSGTGYGSSAAFVLHFNPVIQKTNNDKLTLAIKIRFRRYSP